MEKTFLGSLILRKLEYIEEGIDKFLNGIVMFSVEPFGFLFDLTAEMKATVARLEAEGHIVYTAIQGSYSFSSGEVMDATTYLCLQ